MVFFFNFTFVVRLIIPPPPLSLPQILDKIRLLLDFFFFKDQNIVDMVIFNLISSGFKKKFRVKMFKFLFYEGQIKK